MYMYEIMDMFPIDAAAKRSKPVVVARRLYGRGASGEGDGRRRHEEDEETRTRWAEP